MLIKKHLLSFFVINILLLTNNHNILTVEAQKSSKTPPLPPSSSPPPAATTTSATSATSTTTTTDTHLIPETPKISSKEIIANVPYATTQCTIDDNGPCVLANSTLIRCNGVLKTPDQYINQNTFNGTYQPDQKSLASCVCNLEFYNQLSSCIECFNNYTQSKFEVAPLDSFKSTCQSFGTQFTDVPPDDIKTGIPLRVKVGVGVVVAIILVIISGVILYKCCCGREGKKSIKKVDSMKSLTLLSNDEPLMNKSTSSINKSAYYPPPQSQTNLEYQSSTPQQPSSPTKTGYQQQQQQQTYYPMSSNKSISNVQIPTQSISGEISYYPPPGSSSDSSRYSGPQDNNNNNNFSNDYYGNNRQY